MEKDIRKNGSVDCYQSYYNFAHNSENAMDDDGEIEISEMEEIKTEYPEMEEMKMTYPEMKKTMPENTIRENRAGLITNIPKMNEINIEYFETGNLKTEFPSLGGLKTNYPEMKKLKNENISDNLSFNEKNSHKQETSENVSSVPKTNENISNGRKISENVSGVPKTNENISNGRKTSENVSGVSKTNENISNGRKTSENVSGVPKTNENISNGRKTSGNPEKSGPAKEKTESKERKGGKFYKYGFFACLLALLVVVGFLGFCISGADSAPSIAVININGDMVTGELPYGSGYAGSDTICRLIRKSVDDGCVAIVLRIDSGGGSGSASEEINMEIKRAQDAGIPVIASIGDMGASAAYWVASQCDYIYVTKSTMTGSIGAIGTHTDYSKSLEGEGVTVEIIKSGEFKDMFYPYRELTDDEREYWQKFVDAGASRFIADVAKGRNMSIKEVEKLADGRAYSGDDAVYLKLADGFGNFYTAVDKARELSGESNAPVVYMDYEDYSVLSYLSLDLGENEPDSFKSFVQNIAKAGKSSTEVRFSLN